MSIKVQSPVRLRRESDTELLFAHPALGGWIILPIGLAMAWFGTQLVEVPIGRWATAGMGVLFALFGAMGVLWRHEVRVDLMARTYDRRRGFWPSPRALQGSLTELKCVALDQRWGRDSDHNEHVEWSVALEFQGWDAPLRVFTSRNEQKAHAKLEHYARKLNVAALDRTGVGEKRREADRLDDPLLRTPESVSGTDASFPQQPPTGRIEWGEEGDGARIALPPLGLGAATLFLFLFGAAFEAFGLFALLAVSGVIDVTVSGSSAAIWIVGIVFVLLGGFLSLGSIVGSLARETIREVRDGLQFSLVAFGFAYRNRFVAKRDVEEVTVKPTTSSSRRASRSPKRDVVVRADSKIVRIGESLSREEQQWLCDTLRILSCR